MRYYMPELLLQSRDCVATLFFLLFFEFSFLFIELPIDISDKAVSKKEKKFIGA